MKLSLYSKNDLGFQKQRMALFRPLMVLLRMLRFSPGHLTLLSFLCGLAFFVLLPYNVSWSAVFLLLSALFDMFDGTYARFMKISSNGGAFMDIVNDMIVLALFSLGLVWVGLVHPLVGGFFIFVYTMTVIFQIARNLLKVQRAHPIRTRVILYIVFFVYVVFQYDALTIFMALATFCMAVSSIFDGIVLVRSV